MSVKFAVSPSPHVRERRDTRGIMLDVVIALLPACAVGVSYFGLAALRTLAVSLVFAVISEYLLHRLLKRPCTIGDLSAVVTGLLVGMNLPPDVPIWLPALGAMFAIGIVKVAFGGIGFNFVNPALAARAFLLVSFPVRMTAWVLPLSMRAADTADVVSAATPLALMAQGATATGHSVLLSSRPPVWSAELQQLFWGLHGGSLGEVCAAALLLGGVYLLIRRVITWHTPLIYIGTVFTLSVLFALAGKGGFYTTSAGSVGAVHFALMQLYSGGLLLGAIFMATDYTTSPLTGKGKALFAVGCGLLTVLIRLFGGYPEGVSFAILIMNLFVPLIDRLMRPRAFGHKKGQVKADA